MRCPPSRFIERRCRGGWNATISLPVIRQAGFQQIPTSLELTPDEAVALRTDGDDLVHTNHFLDPLLADSCTSGRGPSTMPRCASAQIFDCIAELHEADPVARMEGVLVSREGMPYPISRDSGSDASTATLAGIVMGLTRNRLILTAGPPHANPWIERPGVG